MDRRSYLSVVGVGGIASLAGCAGVLAPEEDDSGEATMIVESSTVMEIYPHSPMGQPRTARPDTYNDIAVVNQNPDGQSRDFEVTFTGPNETLFDGIVRLEGPEDSSTGLAFFVSKRGEYRCTVTVADETISETWEVTEERLSRGGGTAIIYDGDLVTRGGVHLSEG